MVKTGYKPIKFSFGATQRPNSSSAQVVLSERSTTKLVETNGRNQLHLGAGPKKDVNLRKWRNLLRNIISTAKANSIKKLNINPSDFVFKQLDLDSTDVIEQMVVEFEMANYEYTPYKAKPKDGWKFIESISLAAPATTANKNAVKRGQTIAEAVNGTRDLANAPGGEIHPISLFESAKASARGTKVKVSALGLAEIKRLGMGGVEAVCAGSQYDPRFIILEYNGSSSGKPIVIIGKGVTFDTGGVNIKPSEGIYGMHMDMAGGAAVIQAVIGAAKLGIKKRIVGLVPAVENMPSGSSYLPGDLVTTMSGKTIEVLNTDAEGRVILSDALTYASRYKPQVVIDVATLTGAAMVALGNYANALFTEDSALEERLRELGEASGDLVWPLPLWDEYEADIKGTFGDWTNVGKGQSRMGGAIHGAVFLKQFAEGYPWVHLDIAPRMEAHEHEYLAKGATGTPVRLLLRFLKQA